MKRINKFRLLLAVFACTVAGTATAATTTVSFSSGVPDGWTGVSTAKQTYQSTACVQLRAASSSLTSPTYYEAYTTMVINIARSSNGTSLTVSYQLDDNDAVEITTISLSSSGAFSTETIAIPEAAQVTSGVTFIFEAATASYYIESMTLQSGAESSLSFSTDSYSVATGATDFTEPTLTTDPEDIEVTYSSSDSDIASVNASTGEVTIGQKQGTATITASFAGNDDYTSSEASYTITTSAGTLTGISGLVTQIALDNYTTSSTAYTYEFTVTDAIVTAVSGSYAYIQDAEAGILFYKSSNSLSAGDSYTGTITAEGYIYNGTPRITSLSCDNEATTATIPDAKEETIASLLSYVESLTYTSYGVRTQLSSVTVNSESEIAQDGSTITIVNRATELTAGNSVTLVGYLGSSSGTAQFTIMSNDDITVLDTRTMPTFEFEATTATVLSTDGSFSLELTNTSNGNVTYASSNTDVAAVTDEGTVTILDAGTVDITASVTETNTYSAAEASYTLTILDAEQYTVFTQVTSIDGLVTGDTYVYLIGNAANQQVIGTENGNNFKGTDVTIIDSKAYVNKSGEGIIALTLGGTTDAYTLSNGDNYLAATGSSSSGNYMTYETDGTDASAIATITFDDNGNAVITFGGDAKSTVVKYNKSNALFSCYASTSTMLDVQLYVGSASNIGTSIENEVKAEVTAQCEGIYTLQGIKIETIDRQGLYIINGRKTLVK